MSKALYGLKQAPRAWFAKLKLVLQQLGFTNSRADNLLFFKFGDHSCIWLLVYVDDILVTDNDCKGIQKLINHLNTAFSLKNLGEVHHFLGIEVTHTRYGLHLSQGKYIKELLQKANMLEAKGISTPMITSPQLLKDQGTSTVNAFMYMSIVGAL